MKRLLIVLSTILIGLALAIIVYTNYYDSLRRQIPIVFAEKSMLDSIWYNYKHNYIEEGTFRTLDRQRGDITTSEGQSYSMLRAVWSDDRHTFDNCWKWTQANLNRNEDNLFAWKYGKSPDGSYGIIYSEGGYNTASDADTDIALALIFAYQRWGDKSYLVDAQNIIRDIWSKEVLLTSTNKPILVATDLEKSFNKEEVVVNPSYLAPYAYRIFSQIDPNPWNELVDSSYWLLDKAVSSNLDKPGSANLPPDWIVLNIRTEDVKAMNHPELTTNYSFDALRVTWRLGVDWHWYREPRAKALIERFGLLAGEWATQKKINAIYTHEGQALVDWESITAYACNLVYFSITDEKAAREIYDTKLRILYNPDTGDWVNQLSYYDDNWAWFGIALYEGLLPNLAQTTISFPI